MERQPPHPPARPGLLAGVAAAAPVYPAVALVGLAFGASARSAGVAVEMVAASSLLVFSGAAQLTGLALWLRGAAAFEILAATAVLGLRHLLMAAALLPYVRRTPLAGRAVLAFFLLDESFAVAIQRFARGEDARRLLIGAGGGLYLVWAIATIGGALVSAQVPDPSAIGLDLVFPLLFIGLTAPLLTSRAQVTAAAVAVVCVLALAPVTGTSWAVLAGACAGATAGTWFKEQGTRS